MQDFRAGPSKGLSAIGPVRDGIERYRLELDEATGFVWGRGRGFWSLADGEDYFRKVKPLVDESRKRLGAARVLIDGRGTPAQTPEVAERFEQISLSLYRPEDRVAIVVDSALFKMQLSRVRVGAKSPQVFLSPDEAETWLKTTD